LQKAIFPWVHDLGIAQCIKTIVLLHHILETNHQHSSTNAVALNLERGFSSTKWKICVLSLLSNAVLAWNAWYMQKTVDRLAEKGNSFFP
jgi:hypothetical protein